MHFKRGRDLKAITLFYMVLLYADSGSGKTWRAATAPNPAIALCEANGEQAIIQSNPDAAYTIIRTADDLRDFLRLAQDGTLEEQGIESLVFDGLTEIQQLFKKEITGEGKDFEDMTIQNWGELQETMLRFLRMLRSLSERYNIVCTALADASDVADTRYVKPSFQGQKLANMVMQFFNLVGFVYKKPGASGTDHVVMFDGPARFKCKNCHPIRGTRTDSIANWFQEMRDSLAERVAESKKNA
jgi:hypothetical protein